MSAIFYILLLITLVLAGSAIYRISAGMREYNRDRDRDRDRDRERQIGASFGIESEDARNADFDLFLLRWSVITGVITLIWGVIEFGVRLLS